MLFLMTGLASCNDKDDPQFEPKEYSFRVEVGNITDEGVVVKVIPDQESGTATWYCSVVEEDYFAQFPNDEAYLQDDLANLDKAELADLLKTGQQEIPFSKLTPSTNYVAYAYGLTVNGEATSALAKATFTTQNKTNPNPGDELTFEISVTNISLISADINITPSNNDDTYYFDVSTAKAFDGMSEEEIIADITDGLTADFLSQGPDGLTAEMLEMWAPLSPGTEYSVYAIGFDMQKGVTSKLKMQNFSTLEPTGEAPDLTFEVHVGDAEGNNTSTLVHSQAYSPQAVSGQIFAAPKEAIEPLLNQGATLDEIVSYNGMPLTEEELAKLVVEPGVGITFEVPPATTCMVIMKVTAEGGKSTVKSGEATTTEAQPSDLTFTFSVTDITSNSAVIDITPSNNTDTYFFDIQEKEIIDSYGGDLTSLIAAFDEAYASYGGVAGMVSQGPENYPMDGLSPNTEYSVIAFGYSGAATTGLSTYEFTTEEVVMSDLSFDITIDESAEPIPGGVNATITPSNNEDYYMIAFTLADEIDMLTSDAEIVTYYEDMYGAYIEWLTVAGQYQTLPTDFGGELACMPGADYYLVVFGYSGGATTPVTKVRFTAGAGPDPVGTEFSFNITDLTATTATVEVTASKEPVIYMWDIFTEEEYNQYGGTPQVMKDYVTEMFEYYAGAFTPAQIIAGLGAWYSGGYYEYQELEPGTTYLPFAVCVDANGNIVDEPVIGASFSTPAASTAGVRMDRRSSDNKFLRQMQPQTLTPAAIEQMKESRARFIAEPQHATRGAELAIPTSQHLRSLPIVSSGVAMMQPTETDTRQEAIKSIREALGSQAVKSPMRTAREI